MNMKKLTAGAAAAVLALVGFFVFQNINDSEQPQQASAISQQPVSEQQGLFEHLLRVASRFVRPCGHAYLRGGETAQSAHGPRQRL